MNSVFGILSIAIVATITKADFIEFREDALTNLHLTREGPSTEAFMINSEVKVKFKLRRNKAVNEAHFQANYFDAQNGAGSEHRVQSSRPYHKVVLPETSELFTRVAYIKMKVFGEGRQPQTMRFQVFFKLDGEVPLILEVPIFQIPSNIPGVSNDIQLQQWADQNRVGLKPPFTSDDMLGTQNGVRLTMDFIWLEQLLSHQISIPSVSLPPIGQPQIRPERYVTRPLLLTKDLLNSCLNAIESANLPLNESEGSNESDNSGDDSQSSDSI